MRMPAAGRLRSSHDLLFSGFKLIVITVKKKQRPFIHGKTFLRENFPLDDFHERYLLADALRAHHT